ncbi:formylglycine-generating enzyme family protein [Candidatus Sumerlaeota bacterium]
MFKRCLLIAAMMLTVIAVSVTAQAADKAPAAELVIPPMPEVGPAAKADIVALKAKAFEVPDSVGIVMVKIPAGKFTMGSPKGETARADDEVQHKVAISKPFYMARTEITQDQYIPVVIPEYKPLYLDAAGWGWSLPEVHQGGPFITPSKYNPDTTKYAMEGVIWEKAVEFCAKTTERERKAGRLPAGYVYRLPTEAEWEYACRAGTKGAFNTEGHLKYFCVAEGGASNKRVGFERLPNAFGLYDMHGSVYEWCLDWYGPYANGDQVDPVGPATGERRVARGGCFLSGKIPVGQEADAGRDQRYLRSASRGNFKPELPLGILGFRIVLAPENNYTR